MLFERASTADRSPWMADGGTPDKARYAADAFESQRKIDIFHCGEGKAFIESTKAFKYLSMNREIA
jgi:hypothetical protein